MLYAKIINVSQGNMLEKLELIWTNSNYSRLMHNCKQSGMTFGKINHDNNEVSVFVCLSEMYNSIPVLHES